MTVPKFVVAPDGRVVPIQLPVTPTPQFEDDKEAEAPTSGNASGTTEAEDAVEEGGEGGEENTGEEQSAQPLTTRIDATLAGAGDVADRGLSRVADSLWPEPSPTSRPKNALSDLFASPKLTDNDMQTDDLVAVSEEDIYGGSSDMSDLTDVDFEKDIWGGPPLQPQPRRVVRRAVRRTSKGYPPPTTLGGLSY